MSLKMRAIEDAFVRDWVSAAGTDETLRYYFGEYADDGAGPQGFLTTVTGRTIPSHNHAVDQFQVMLGVPGATYQRHEIPPLMLHYADAFSTYGPIGGGTDPCLRFFTLRPRMDKTMFVMPADKKDVPYLARRQKHVEIEPLTDEDRPDAGEVITSSLIDAEPDGLEALLLNAGPEATIEINPSPSGNGQYVYVASGSVEWDGATYQELSLGWQLPDDGVAQLQAGADGARLIVMRYPTPATNAEIEAQYIVPANA